MLQLSLKASAICTTLRNKRTKQMISEDPLQRTTPVLASFVPCAVSFLNPITADIEAPDLD